VSPATAASDVALRKRSALSVPTLPGEAVTAWALAFGLVFYLALKDGGYDVVIRDQVGVLVWWAVLLVAVAGLLPRLTLAGWVAVGLLAAWALWTALGISGSESAERTLTEVGRISTYLGVLVLALTVQGRAGSRHVVNGVATAIGVITALAVLSRLHPQWFPHNDQIVFLKSGAHRLSYPLNYWNALCGFMATGAVLLLGVAGSARTRLGQGLAAGALPLVGLGAYLCVSRGGVIVLVVGVIVYLALTEDRLGKLGTVLIGGAGAAILVDAAIQRDAVQTGIDTAAARSQGAELIWLSLIVCAAVGLLQIALGLATRHATRPAFLRPSPRVTAGLAAAGVLVVVLVFFGSSLHHEVAHYWREFKVPPGGGADPSTGDVFARLQSSSGQGRWQFWQSAVDAYHSSPWHGIGAGTFEFWWARHATIAGSVVDAHSLYAQTLAEQGLPGVILLGLLVVLSVGLGAFRALRAEGPARVLLAAATAGIVVFWVHATVEWVWQMAVMPVVLLFLIAVVVGHRTPHIRPVGLPFRVGAVLLAIVAFIPVAVNLSTTQQVRASQSDARQGRLVDAIKEARRADRIQGTSATAMLQEALVLEEAGALAPALTAATRATDAEPTNWRTWLTRSRLEARLGQDGPALAHFRKARRLNPKSPLFAS
jgi:tetratricopeptide (TPR) repeat protein